MNATAIPVQDLACQLLDAAGGIPAGTAAAGLIISRGHFLHRQAFRRHHRRHQHQHRPAAGRPSAGTTALHALEDGFLPCASSEQAVLRIAASLGDPAIPRSPARRPRQPRPAQHHPGHRRHHSRQRLTPPVSRLTG